MKDPIQTIIRVVEVGEGQFLIRLVPLVVSLFILAGLYNLSVYRGLSDAQSMDNAQLARQIVRGQGYTTKFLRPHALADLRNRAVSQSLGTGRAGELFPANRFPPGTPRILPDTYNAPGYPCLLAGWFYLIRPQFNQPVSPRLDGFLKSDSSTTHVYAGDRWIPLLNLIFMLLTGLLVYVMGRRLFDDRVAWFGTVAFFATDMVWQYTVTALSTSFLMFLVTALLACSLEIFCIAEACFESEESSFGLAWFWAVILSLLLAATCLTRLDLLVLLVPMAFLLTWMPRPSWMAFLMITLVVIAFVTPWFWHMTKVSGNPLGSNVSLLIYGEDGYEGNQIYCASSIPSYESLLRNVVHKETVGFIWHLEHGWRMLGSNPMVLMFGASLMHPFKRRRAQMFQWLLLGCAVVVIAASNASVATPEVVGPWNMLALLFPGMVLVGSAFFFILFDRLNLQVQLLNSLIVAFTLTLAALPMVAAVCTESAFIYSFPPYMPPLIKALGQYTQPDEWVTTDMPWASAWYADRASLWLPDSLTDFEGFHDNTCPTGILYFTPVTWMQPTENILSGEDKDWLPFITGFNVPADFPLRVHTSTPTGGPEYDIWSDRPRWQMQ